jgi:hypothetical protein
MSQHVSKETDTLINTYKGQMNKTGLSTVFQQKLVKPDVASLAPNDCVII